MSREKAWCRHEAIRATDTGFVCMDCGASAPAPRAIDVPLVWGPGFAPPQNHEAPATPKPRPDLIPADALLEVGHVLAWGLDRPGLDAERWRGLGVRGNLASAVRHVLEHLAGRTADAETGRPHLAHAGARVLFALALHLEESRR